MNDNRQKNISLSSIMVAVRVRPFSTNELQLINGGQKTHNSFASAANLTTHSNNKGALRKIVHTLDDHMLAFDPPVDSAWGEGTAFKRSQIRYRDEKFAFDKVFNEDASQEDVFSGTSKDLIEEVLNGFNSTVFAYGATGCGKTHTISGTPEQPGIIFLTMKELYDRLKEAEQEKTFKASMSYLEVYNETIRDLLVSSENRPNLRLREVAKGGVVVAGLSEHYPKDVEEVMQLIIFGNQNRTMSPTEANATSSRSHAVIQINIRQQPRTQNISSEYTVSTLSFIDLAGSERAATTKNKSLRMVEGANINRSLLALGSCINALCKGEKNTHIPYRNSNLTRLLKFSLGGNCKTVMIVCVSPSSLHLEETYNTLKYADRAKNIKTRIAKNTLSVNMHVSQYVNIIKELRKEINELKNRVEFGDRKSTSLNSASKGIKNDPLNLLESTREKIRKSYHKIYARELDFHQKSHLIDTCTKRLQLLNSWIHACAQISSNPNNHFTNKIKDTALQLETRRSSLERDVMFAAQALDRTKGVQLQQISSFVNAAKDRLSPLMIKILDQDQILLEKEFDNALLKFQKNGYGKTLETNQPLMEQFMALNATTIATFKDFSHQSENLGIYKTHLDNIYSSSVATFTQASQLIPQVNDKFDRPFIGSVHTTPTVQKRPGSITSSPALRMQSENKVFNHKPLQSILKGGKRGGVSLGDTPNGINSEKLESTILPKKKVRIVADSPVSKKMKNSVAVAVTPKKSVNGKVERTPMRPVTRPKPLETVSKISKNTKTRVLTPNKPSISKVASKPVPELRKQIKSSENSSVFDRLSRSNKGSNATPSVVRNKGLDNNPANRLNGKASQHYPNHSNNSAAAVVSELAIKPAPHRPVSPTKQVKSFSYKSVSNPVHLSPSISRINTVPKNSSPLANPKYSITSSPKINIKVPPVTKNSPVVAINGSSRKFSTSPSLEPNRSVFDSLQFNIRPMHAEEKSGPGSSAGSNLGTSSPLLERRFLNIHSSPLLAPRRRLNLPDSPQIQLRRQSFQPTTSQTSAYAAENSLMSPQTRSARSSLVPSITSTSYNTLRPSSINVDFNISPNRRANLDSVNQEGDSGKATDSTNLEPVPNERPTLMFPRMSEAYTVASDLEKIDRELDMELGFTRE